MDWGKLIIMVLGWFGFSKSTDAGAPDREAGENLGKAKAGEANAVSGLREVEGAVAASEAERDLVAGAPGKLHDVDNPAARTYTDRAD